MFCRDFFPALRSFITRDCTGTSVILSIFSYTWYWLQNRIFLTVSDNYWILNRKIQARIRETWIFRTPLGGWSCSHHMVHNVRRLILRLANTSFPSTDIKKVSKESESQRSKVHESFYFTVMSHLQPEKFKIFCRDFFHALRSFITRDCMGTSVILSIFPRLHIHSKTDFSWLYPTIIEFWIEKRRLE